MVKGDGGRWNLFSSVACGSPPRGGLPEGDGGCHRGGHGESDAGVGKEGLRQEEGKGIVIADVIRFDPPGMDLELCIGLRHADGEMAAQGQVQEGAGSDLQCKDGSAG